MIGEKIRKRRIELGLTQEQLAHRLGYKSKSTINKIELNVHDVSQTNLMRIANVLGLEPIELIDEPVHDSYSRAEIREYAAMLADLPQKDLDNVIKYIKFLSQQKGDDDT